MPAEESKKETPPSDDAKDIDTDEDKKGLNPDAKSFTPQNTPLEGGRPKKKRTGSKKQPFQMNPNATPWLPTSFQSSTQSLKPVILLFGPPGTGKATVGAALAEKFGGKHYSSSEYLKKVHDSQKSFLDTVAVESTLWKDTAQVMKGLDTMLAETVKDPSVKGYFLEVQGKNAAVFFYVVSVLKKHGLAPGQVLYLKCDDTDVLIKKMGARFKDAVGESEARKRIEFYRRHEKARMRLFNQAKGLVFTIDASQDLDDIIKNAENFASILFQRILSYSLPHPTPIHGLTPIEDPDEYAYVMDFVCDRLAGGDYRWPACKGNGVLKKDSAGKIGNEAVQEGKIPTQSSHRLYKTPSGIRMVLLHCGRRDDPAKGRFYLIPRDMEVVFTFAPRVGEEEFASGEAPPYKLEEDANVYSFITDGFLVETKTGWGGLQGLGCTQSMYLATDLLYFEPSKPRERLARQDLFTLDKRLEMLNTLAWPMEEFATCDMKTVSLCIKRYFDLQHLDDLLHAVGAQTDPYKTIGVTFVPTRKYLLWNDSQYINWISPVHRTIDLMVRYKNPPPKKEALVLEDEKKESDEPTDCVLYCLVGPWNKPTEEAVAEVVLPACKAEEVDGQVVPCRAVWEGKPGGKKSWEVGNVPPVDLYCADKNKYDEYLDPNTWIAAEELQGQLAPEVKISMKQESATVSPPRGGSGGGRGSGGRGAASQGGKGANAPRGRGRGGA